jgi:hypothetical protein
LSKSDETAGLGAAGGMTVSVAPCEFAPSIARIKAGIGAATGAVVIAKAALVAPLGTRTLGGTVAASALLESETETPPTGAGPERLTVPEALLPPTTLLAARESPLRIGADTVAGDGSAIRLGPENLVPVAALSEPVKTDVTTAANAAAKARRKRSLRDMGATIGPPVFATHGPFG